MTEHALITDPDFQLRARGRYAAEVASLQRLGFQILGCALETEGPFSAILQLPALLLMLLNREVLAFPGRLRLAVATVLLIHTEPSSVALCMGLGVKFYTRFDDETILISSTFKSYAVPRPTSKIIKSNPSRSIENVWPVHSQYVRQLEAQSRRVHRTTTFGDFVEIALREEDPAQYK